MRRSAAHLAPCGSLVNAERRYAATIGEVALFVREHSGRLPERTGDRIAVTARERRLALFLSRQRDKLQRGTLSSGYQASLDRRLPGWRDAA